MTTSTNSALDLFDSLAKLGATETEAALAGVKTDTATAVGVFLNENGDDKAALIKLKEFVENGGADSGSDKALGGSTSGTTPNEAMNILLGSDKLPDGVKKALLNLIKGNLKVDDEGNPAASAGTSPEQKDLEKKVRVMADAIGSIGSKLGVSIVDSNYSRFANDAAKAIDNRDKTTQQKAADDTEAKYEESVPKKKVHDLGESAKSWLDAATKAKTSQNMVFSPDDYKGLKEELEQIAKI